MNRPDYYRMPRGWMDDAIFAGEPLSERMAWCWLIENAAEQGEVRVIGKASVRVGRGDVATSWLDLAKAWGWADTSRVAPFLGRLTRLGMVSISDNPTSKLIIIHLTNYDRDQGDSRAEQSGGHGDVCL